MTLDDNEGTVLILPNSLEWLNRFSNRVRQDTRFTIGGSFIVQENSVKSGVSVTLSGGVDVWVSYQLLQDLHALSNVVGKTFKLTMPDGFQMDVKFRHPNPFSASPVLRCNTYEPDSQFNNFIINLYRVDEV